MSPALAVVKSAVCVSIHQDTFKARPLFLYSLDLYHGHLHAATVCHHLVAVDCSHTFSSLCSLTFILHSVRKQTTQCVTFSATVDLKPNFPTEMLTHRFKSSDRQSLQCGVCSVRLTWGAELQLRKPMFWSQRDRVPLRTYLERAQSINQSINTWWSDSYWVVVTDMVSPGTRWRQRSTSVACRPARRLAQFKTTKVNAHASTSL